MEKRILLQQVQEIKSQLEYVTKTPIKEYLQYLYCEIEKLHADWETLTPIEQLSSYTIFLSEKKEILITAEEMKKK